MPGLYVNEGSGVNAVEYTGEYEVVPAVDEQTLFTAQKIMKRNLVVNAIPYLEVSNEFNGETITIG